MKKLSSIVILFLILVTAAFSQQNHSGTASIILEPSFSSSTGFVASVGGSLDLTGSSFATIQLGTHRTGLLGIGHRFVSLPGYYSINGDFDLGTSSGRFLTEYGFSVSKRWKGGPYSLSAGFHSNYLQGYSSYASLYLAVTRSWGKR